MLRAPIWITSACSTTASTCRGSISSVTIGSPVSSRASTRISSASSPSPLNVYGDVRGLNAPPRSIVDARLRDRARGLHRLLAVLDRARAGDQSERVVADAPAAHLDHGRIRRELARHELVWLQDRHHLLDARVALERQRCELVALADRGDHGRLAPGRDVRVRARFGEALDDVVDLLGRRVGAHHDQELGGSRHGHGTQDTFALDHADLQRHPAERRPAHRELQRRVPSVRRDAGARRGLLLHRRPPRDHDPARPGRPARGHARHRGDAVRDRPRSRALDGLRPEPRHRARRGGLAAVVGRELRPARPDDAVQGEGGGRGVRLGRASSPTRS